MFAGRRHRLQPGHGRQAGIQQSSLVVALGVDVGLRLLLGRLLGGGLVLQPVVEGSAGPRRQRRVGLLGVRDRGSGLHFVLDLGELGEDDVCLAVTSWL